MEAEGSQVIYGMMGQNRQNAVQTSHPRCLGGRGIKDNGEDIDLKAPFLILQIQHMAQCQQCLELVDEKD
jgi:hypothetical protein